MPSETDLRTAAVAEARSWIGVPFRHQGRSRRGVDCVGLLVQIGRALDVPHDDVTGYTRRAQGMGFLEHFRAHLTEIALTDAGPGDVAVFIEHLYPCHTGLLSDLHGVPHLIHAHAGRGQVMEEPFQGEWPARLRFAFRFPDLQEV
ncbi:hypothetical protein ACVDG3_20000 [Meridianimarinicoccus sp. RP-17]|uniref:peptidoglycan endopeptidase n=1 Tax=Meridianimarinicoccus zhengii TaxID=2056810 RepID=UPI000DAB783F|nr:peptidoglycan endopeptidase [Phycocomes zhengii]